MTLQQYANQGVKHDNVPQMHIAEKTRQTRTLGALPSPAMAAAYLNPPVIQQQAPTLQGFQHQTGHSTWKSNMAYRPVDKNAPAAAFLVPVNPFCQEKLPCDHPAYPGAQVDIAPADPLLRNIPFEKRTNFFVTMGQQNKQRFQEAYQAERNVPHFETKGAIQVPLRTREQRPHEPRDISTGKTSLYLLGFSLKYLFFLTTVYETITLDPTPHTLNTDDKLTWRNASNSYAVQSLAYEGNLTGAHPRVDYRLECRKQRQAAYQQRRACQKERIAALQQQFLINKQQDLLRASGHYLAPPGVIPNGTTVIYQESEQNHVTPSCAGTSMVCTGPCNNYSRAASPLAVGIAAQCGTGGQCKSNSQCGTTGTCGIMANKSCSTGTCVRPAKRVSFAAA